MFRILTLFLALGLSGQLWAHGDHGHSHDDHNEDNHSIHIEAATAEQAGVRLALADSGTVEKHVQVYGRLATPPTQQAQVRARFPGLVVRLYANTGDTVKAGQVLAVVESNESLRRYEVKSPITGMVQDRWLNEGEISTEAPLFTLLNQDELWAELTIFPSQRAAVKVGQPVHVRHNGHDHNSRIASITPANLSGSALPYVIARVPLKNEHQDMVAGDKVLADIDAQTLHAAVRIERDAVQELDGQQVVFVHHAGEYSARPVTLGLQDDHYSEVLEGLAVGEEYVAANSYLLKADLGKAEAAHEH